MISSFFVSKNIKTTLTNRFTKKTYIKETSFLPRHRIAKIYIWCFKNYCLWQKPISVALTLLMVQTETLWCKYGSMLSLNKSSISITTDRLVNLERMAREACLNFGHRGFKAFNSSGPREQNYCRLEWRRIFLIFLFWTKIPLFTFSLLLVIFNSENRHKNYLESPARKIKLI